MIRQNLFENGIIQVSTFWKEYGIKRIPIDIHNMHDYIEQPFYNFDIIKINEKELIYGNTYLIYCNKTGKHYWAIQLSRYLEVFKEVLFNKNNKWIGNGYIISLSILKCNLVNYSIYETLHMGEKWSFKPVIPLTYSIVSRCKKYWKRYCDELNEDLNECIPVKKISHMKEITDLIASFL